MKKSHPRILSPLLALCLIAATLLTACQTDFTDSTNVPEQNGPVQSEPVQDVPIPAVDAVAPEDAIRPLEVQRYLVKPESANGIEPYSAYHQKSLRTIPGDLSGNLALAYSLSFCDMTVFPDDLPLGYDPETLMEWGINPGLNVDILHEHGFTGKGAVIAYVDQPISDHEQYNDANIHYTNNTDSAGSMHGSTVLSLLAGKETGTAPEAEIYYYSHGSLDSSKATREACLYQIIEQNKTLPEGEKITMVGFSYNITPNDKKLQKAVTACEEAGIVVWFCGDYAAGVFLPLSDKNDYRNLVPDSGWLGGAGALVYVPDASCTTAAQEGDSHYIYWAFNGGLSWTMPYMLGLYAIANEIDPTLTQDQLRELVVDTAYKNNGMPIINPVGFIAAVLDGADRSDEAETLRRAAAARDRYVYAVMDTAAMSTDDLTAVSKYLAAITNASVLMADASAFSTAQALYATLEADAAQRGGTVVGVQIFGTPEWNVEQSPQWPVACLPLSQGTYADFFDQYQAFVTDTGLSQPAMAFSSAAGRDCILQTVLIDGAEDELPALTADGFSILAPSVAWSLFDGKTNIPVS